MVLVKRANCDRKYVIEWAGCQWAYSTMAQRVYGIRTAESDHRRGPPPSRRSPAGQMVANIIVSGPHHECRS
jgi:hypothetical protein